MMLFFKKKQKQKQSERESFDQVSVTQGKLEIRPDFNAVDGYSMIVNLEKCLEKITENLGKYLDEIIDKKTIIAWIKTLQSDLLPNDGFDEGFEYDFEVIDESSFFIKIVGNLKTALVTLRHGGLLSFDETEMALIDADELVKNYLDLEKYHFYEAHYSIAARGTAEVRCPHYQSSILEKLLGLKLSSPAALI